MKKLMIALATAVLLTVQLFSPVAASASTSVQASDICGTTYIVKNRDNLTKIASYCGTTLAVLLADNPQIINPNLIYSGQVLAVTASGVSSTTYANTYTVKSSDTLQSIASMFGTTTWAIMQANPTVWNTGSVYSGQVINIPASSYTGSPRVSLSTTTASAGNSVTVYVRGFPANASIDYRVGLQGQNYSVAYDGTVASDGSASVTVTIPSSATVGQYWVVLVTTTSQKNGVDVTSPTIYINN